MTGVQTCALPICPEQSRRAGCTDPYPQQQGKDSPDPTKIPLDIEALKAALDKGGDSTKEQPQELAQTGNPTIDAGVAMLQKVSGLTDSDMVRALGKALEYQDPNLIDTAFIKERFGEHAAYAELLAKAYLEDQVGQATKAVQEAYDIVGGKENWEVGHIVTGKQIGRAHV